MENNMPNREEIMYQAYIKDLDAEEWGPKWEAYEQASYVAGMKDRKPHQEALLEAALKKVEAGPPKDIESDSNRFLKMLADRYRSSSKSVDFDHLGGIMDRVAAMEGAVLYTRKIALGALFDVPQLHLTQKTVETVKKAFESKKRLVKNSFEEEAVKLTIEALKEHHRSRQEEGKPLNELYKLFISEALEGKIDEGELRSFTRDLRKNWDPDDELDYQFLVSLRDSSTVAPDIKQIASAALKI